MVKQNIVATSDGLQAFDWWAAKWVDFPGQDIVSFHYVAQRGTGANAGHAREVVRRLLEADPDPKLERALRSVRSDIDWRVATLAYLLTAPAAGMRDEAGP